MVTISEKQKKRMYGISAFMRLFVPFVPVYLPFVAEMLNLIFTFCKLRSMQPHMAADYMAAAVLSPGRS